MSMKKGTCGTEWGMVAHWPLGAPALFLKRASFPVGCLRQPLQHTLGSGNYVCTRHTRLNEACLEPNCLGQLKPLVLDRTPGPLSQTSCTSAHSKHNGRMGTNIIPIIVINFLAAAAAVALGARDSAARGLLQTGASVSSCTNATTAESQALTLVEFYRRTGGEQRGAWKGIPPLDSAMQFMQSSANLCSGVMQAAAGSTIVDGSTHS